MRKKHFDFSLTPNILYIILFLCGFLPGMIFAFLNGTGNEENQMLWLDSTLLYLQYGEFNYSDMLFYVLKKRLKTLVWIVLFCISGKGYYFLLAGIALAGGFCGFFITECIAYKGMLGSILFFFVLFPQYLCYVYGYYCLLVLLSGNKKANISIDRLSRKQNGVSLDGGSEFMKKILPVVVVIIGVLLECYVNPFFLKIFLKIFM